jgi:hypothetical protein
MSQSRVLSGLEALTNVVVGYGLAVAAQVALFPVFGLVVTAPQALGLGAIFTGLSLARSYLLRRLFARWGS